MSVRKISELPYVDVKDKSLASQLNNSLMEISFSNNAQQDQAYWFTSKYMKYKDFVDMLKESVFDQQGNFYQSVHFLDNVYMHNGLDLCGNFLVNDGIDDSELANYSTVIRSNRNTLYAKVENVLSSPTINAYTDTFCIRKFDGTDKKIATFSTAGVNFHVPINGSVHFNERIEVDATTKLNGNLSCYGNAYFKNDIQGCALCARWADLAEGYETDQEYEPGTFVMFGGSKEITISKNGDANAVITTKPGFVLGADGRTGKIQNIALVGRTPVKVVGPVRKFDKLVMSKIPGVAISWNQVDFVHGGVVGRALSDSIVEDKNEIHLVEAVVQLQL